MKKETVTVVYPRSMRPSRYDEAHFLCYLNETSAEYKDEEDSEPVPGFSYTGTMGDGGTLIECDEWNRDKLINAVLRTQYMQTEEDAIKTHQLQVLQAKLGLAELSDEKISEYESEWAQFETARQNAIKVVDSWDDWS